MKCRFPKKLRLALCPTLASKQQQAEYEQPEITKARICEEGAWKALMDSVNCFFNAHFCSE